MPSSTNTLKTIDQILREQIDAATTLVRVLDREAAAIKARDAEALTALAPEKLEGLQRLEALEQSKEQTTSNAASGSASDNKLWEHMLQIVGECSRKNQLNGVMLSLRQEHIQRAMDLIANRDTAAMVYAPDGSTQGTAGHFSTSVSA